MKNQLKRDTSVMEYFNNFFREDNLSQNIYDDSNISNNSHRRKFSNSIRHASSSEENSNSNFQNESLRKFNFKEANRKISNANYANYPNQSDEDDEDKKSAGENKNKEITKQCTQATTKAATEATTKESSKATAENNNNNNKSNTDNSNKSNSNNNNDNKSNINNSNSNGTPTNTNLNLLKKKFIKKYKKNFQKTTELITADWFMISSAVFRNTQKYPPIRVDNNIIKIETDDFDFRLNQAFGHFEGIDKPPSKKFFWLRLSGLNLYYSSSRCDLNILGVISLSHLVSTSKLITEYNEKKRIFCFRVTDKSEELWKICGLREEIVKDLYCQLNVILHSNEKFCESKKKEKKFSSKHHHSSKQRVIQPLIIFPKPSRQCNENWNYALKGADWECDCKEGKEQAPINLPKSSEVIDSPISPLFHYFRVKAKIDEDSVDGLMREGENLKIRVSKNSLRIQHPNFGKIITVDGSVYKAEEILIHTPSEHTLDGKKYDAELQVIHFGQSKGDIAKQIVLSFLFENTPGEYNKFFESIDAFNLPNVVTKERSLCGDVFIPEVFYSAEAKEEINSLKKFSFFTYQGSLTAPPCTENTIMYVASKPIPLSTTTIRLMQEAIRVPDYRDERDNLITSEIGPENDRVIQNRNGRPVFYFDHQKYCGPDQNKKKEENGHYEKIKMRKEKIFYVNNNKPSGLPEAFVISKDEAFGDDVVKRIKQKFNK